jgi:hypothetical protein
MAGLLLAGAALIMVAALAVIRRWRRGSGQPPAPAGARGAAAGPAGRAVARHEIAIVPGFGGAVPPGPQPGPHGPGPPANGQRATARAVTTSEQIASYYDQADKPMADYLTALGWAHQPPHSPQPAGPAERTSRHPPNTGSHKQ